MNDYFRLNGNAGMERAGDFRQMRDHTFESPDPRTMDVIRNMRIALDAPPLQTVGTQPSVDVYSSSNDTVHTGFYKNYSDIHSGSIVYYTDKDTAFPYTSPTFILPADVSPSVLQDPMGGLHPYYERIPRPDATAAISEYSFDRDQMAFREDIMALQQQKRNSRKWETYKYFSHE